MQNLPGRLGTLKAIDIMTRDVTLLRESESLSAAIQTLRGNHITGAPVVDQDGKLVGILSISDLMKPTNGDDGATDSPTTIPLAHGNDRTSWELFDIAIELGETHAEAIVGQKMSRTITSVTENSQILNVARVMCDGHWHRVPVVDEYGALQGIISTMDILAALVNATDEAS
jgi:CBS-domain-containing membrane protein